MSIFKWKVFVILCSCVLFRTILGNTVPITVTGSKNADRPKLTSVLPILRFCIRQSEIVSCLKNYAIEKLDNAIESDQPYVINEFISINRDPTYQHHLMESGERERSLNQILFSRIRDFLASRIISFKLTPKFMEEGRKKKFGGGGKHGHGMWMGGMAMMGMMLHMVLGKLAFLAGAALLMAKMSLFVSLLGSMKKLVGGGGSTDSHVVVTDHGHGHGGGYGGGGGWQRSINSRTPDEDQQLPYKGYTSSELAGV